MKIGIIGAMEYEVGQLIDALEDVSVERHLGRDFYAGTLDDVPVVVVMCGIGKVNAALCAHSLIAFYGVTHVINTGCSGSLDPTLDIGDIVVARDAVQHDMDAGTIGFPKGQVPDVDVLFFESDPVLRLIAVRAIHAVAPEVRAIEGRVASGDQFIADAADKIRIIEEFGALCCEMEGAAVAHACHLAGVPFVIVRAISDKADGSAEMDFADFARQASARSAAIVEYMVRSLGWA